MPKVGTRSYTLELTDQYKNKTIVIEPPTQIQFDITMAIYTQLSIGHIKIYNPDLALKNALIYKYPVGDYRNRIFIELKPIKLGVTKTGNEAYNYASSIKAYVYQTTLIHPNPKEEYIHLQLLSGLYELFSRTYNTADNALVSSTLMNLKLELANLGYPVSYDGELTRDPKPFTWRGSTKAMLDRLLGWGSEDLKSYVEDLQLKIFNGDHTKGKGSKGYVGSYDNPYEIDPENGLMSFPQQVNNDIQFRFTLDRKFPLDSYVRVSQDLINSQIVTPSLSAGAGGLNWLLGAEDKYRVLSYRWVGDYFDPNVWYQDIVAQAGNMPLAANLQYNPTIGAI